ncbi:unnamed protein product [Brassica rapa subsp. trilocularis]
MCKTDAKMQMGPCHNTLSLIKYPKKRTSFISRASLFMDYPRNMFYVVQDLQMKRNMVLFTLLFAILIKSQIYQSVSISFLAGINACLKNIECITELHEISLAYKGYLQDIVAGGTMEAIHFY